MMVKIEAKLTYFFTKQWGWGWGGTFFTPGFIFFSKS